MMKLFDNVFFDISPVCRTILGCMEVEDMWVGIIGGFKDT